MSTIEEVLSGAATHHVACERAEAFIDRLPDGCVSLMTLDFPYYGVKDDAWDNAWESPEAFIAWMGGILAQCRRALAPNGSIYVFASPEMAWKVEGAVRALFTVISNVRWQKDSGWHKKTAKEELRGPFSASETIILAEHDFEWARAYLDDERRKAGISFEEVRQAVGCADGSGLPSHWFTRSQWMLPPRSTYETLRTLFNRNGGGFLARDYDSLRRPFNVSPDVPYTDVWTYRTVNTYAGKHPCEKPEDMARDIVRASSREGGIVADFFCGSGAFLAAAVAEGRRAIGCDMDPHWAEQAQRRCDAAKVTGRVVRTAPKPKDDRQLDIFARKT